MYAVVKGVPTKESRPKLVGATGSGTVVAPRSREESLSSNRPTSQDRSRSGQRSNTSSTDRSENVFRADLIGRNIDRRAANPPPPAPSTGASSSHKIPRPAKISKSDSQATLVHSKADSSNSSKVSSKRESVQSFTSFSSLDESIPEDSVGSMVFDNRNDAEEATTLLQKQKDGRDHERSTATKPEKPATSDLSSKVAKEGTSAKATPFASFRGRQPVLAGKYSGGTPLGTAKTGSTPENSTLDSTDPLFQPTAPLISYPALDAYLSSLKPVHFSDFPKSSTFPGSLDALKSASAAAGDSDSTKSSAKAAKSKKTPPPDPREGMFPPLNLVPVGITLDELKSNITKPPGFFDQELQNVMLSSAVDGIMSGESSNIGVSWMQLETIRDFLQFVALYLSVSGNSFVNQKWLYASVNIIPAVLSLDFPRALGYGMVFLMLFALICWIALYTFKIMTRTDPNDDIEVRRELHRAIRMRVKYTQRPTNGRVFA